MQDHDQLVAEGRIVGDAIGDGGKQEMAGTVLVLKALARQRRATRRRAEEKAAGTRITRRPDEIADALEAEAGIENVERQHRHAMCTVARRRGNPGRHGASFADAFL